MRRLPILAVLVVAAIIGASAWLAIDARSDPEPLPVAEHLPRDDEQSQQERSQAEPEPSPEDQSGDQEPTPNEADEVDEGPAEGEVADEPVEPEEVDDGQSTQAAEQQEAQEQAAAEAEDIEEEVAAVVGESEPLNPADVIINALDVDRPPMAREDVLPVVAITHLVAEGETLTHVAERYEVPLEELIELNNLQSADLLSVGRTLIVTVGVAALQPDELQTAIEVAPGMTEEGIIYGTIQDHERGAINSAVVAISESDTDIQLVAACIDATQRMYVLGLTPEEGLTRVYWRVDAGPLQLDRWTVADGLVESSRVRPLFDDLQTAEALWLRVGGVDTAFSVASMFPSEVHLNLIDCGER